MQQYSIESIRDYVCNAQRSRAATFGCLVEEGETLPPIKQLWGNYIFEKSLVHFPSLRGSAKSLLMMQICIAIAAGHREFLGEKITLNGKTAFIDFEMPENFVKRRAYMLYQNPPLSVNKSLDNFIIFSTRNSFETEFSNITKLLVQERPILVVIDNLRTALRNANTNSAIDMANFFSILGGIRELYNCAIVVIDHTRKGTKHLRSDSDLQSGSGAKTDLSDGDFQIRHSCQDKQLRLIRRLKSRMFEESDETKLIRLNPATLWFELVAHNVNEAEHIGISNIPDKEELIDLAKDLLKQGKTFQQIAGILNKPKTTIHRWLQQNSENTS